MLVCFRFPWRALTCRRSTTGFEMSVRRSGRISCSRRSKAWVSPFHRPTSSRDGSSFRKPFAARSRSPTGATGVTTDETIARVSLVGAGMKSNPGVAATMFETLAAAGINIEMISTSAIRISCVVREADIEAAVQVLHSAFELDLDRE